MKEMRSPAAPPDQQLEDMILRKLLTTPPHPKPKKVAEAPKKRGRPAKVKGA